MTSENDIVSKFIIELDAGTEPVFKGDELITGKLLIELKKPIIINAVKLQMKGRAAITNDPHKNNDIEKVYFDQAFTLLERPPGNAEPGHFKWNANFTYRLPFECPLPKGLPNSYEGPHAFVRYFIRATLVQENEFNKTTEYYAKKAFSIVAPSDGYMPTGAPAQAEDSTTFGKCCCKNKVAAELKLSKTGYLPGENVYGDIIIGKKHPQDILQNMEVRLVDRAKRLSAPDVADESKWRAVMVRKLETGTETPTKVAGRIEQLNVFLITIPSVCPSTRADMLGEMESLKPNENAPESPSSMKFRKNPFLKIEYAIQVTLGTDIVLEIPIEIGELPTNDGKVSLVSFAAGAQPIVEDDDRDKIAINGPFMFTPVYPYPSQQAAVAKTVANSVDSAAAAIKPALQSQLSHTSEPERTIVTTTRTIVTHTDGHESKTMDETVVETEGEVVKTIHETAVNEDGVKSERIETTTIDAAGNEKIAVEEAKTRVAESAELPQAIKEAREKLEEAVTNSADSQATPAEPTVEMSVNELGEETIVSTEVIEQNGKHIVKTTTATKHTDGSESTMVQENITSEITNSSEE